MDAETLRLRPAALQRGGLRLVVLGAAGHSVHALPEAGSVLLGRGRDAGVRIEEASISRRHALLHLGPELRLEDLGSANGSRVRGRALQPGETVELAPGDAFELGGVLLVVQRDPLAGGAAAPRPAAAGGMEALRALLDRLAQSPISVVLLGETGVGKSALAAEIHRRSPRAAGPFVSVNCAAMAPSLLESELFGHERGAFTGAVAAREGLFEAASGGTVFLDEIGEMPLEMQAKLLEVLEERAVRRVGGTSRRPVDVRVLSASNRDLPEAVAQGRFRADLWFRLDGISLRVPPLRERTGEIEELARGFAAQAAQAAGRPAPALSPEAREALLRHRWPGNIRELRNLVERAVVLCGDGPITAAHLPLAAGPLAPAGVPAAAPAVAPAAAPEGAGERARIAAALEQCGGNQRRAAELLGISRRTLVTRLSQLGLPRPRKR